MRECGRMVYIEQGWWWGLEILEYENVQPIINFSIKEWWLVNFIHIISIISSIGKILHLSQTNTSYYQIHKIQSITKRHVLLLGFNITTQKPTEICQVSCKKTNHTSTHVSDDTSSPTRVSNDISEPIRLWHVSPIKLRHVSLTHP